MRQSTQKKINALHNEIEKLIREEKEYHDCMNPEQDDLMRTIAHTKIEFQANSPSVKRNARYATASYPS